MSVAIVKAETVRIARPGRLGPIKDLFASPIECRQAAKALIQVQNGITFCPLFIDIKDTNLTAEHIGRIQGTFSLGKITTDAIVRMAPGVTELAVRLSEVQAISVSSRYQKGGTISKPLPMAGEPGRLGKYLFLNLDAVLAEVGIKEKAAAEAFASQVFDNAKTMLNVGEGERRVLGKSGTVILGYRTNPGDEMFCFAVQNLLPIDVEKLYGWDKVTKAFGHGENAARAIGEYEAEIAIAFKLHELGLLNDNTFEIILMTMTGGHSPKERADRITIALKSCGGHYLFQVEGGKNQLERDLDKTLKNRAVERKFWFFKTTIIDVYRAILKNNRIGLSKEDAAILALIVAAQDLTMVTKERAIDFVSRDPEKGIGEYMAKVKAYISSEETRIFTLRKVITALIALGS